MLFERNLTGHLYDNILWSQIISAFKIILDKTLTNFGLESLSTLLSSSCLVEQCFPTKIDWLEDQLNLLQNDLIPLDFFIWECLKNKVYKTKPKSTEIPRDILIHEYIFNSNVYLYWYLKYCCRIQAVGGLLRSR